MAGLLALAYQAVVEAVFTALLVAAGVQLIRVLGALRTLLLAKAYRVETAPLRRRRSIADHQAETVAGLAGRRTRPEHSR